MLSRCSGSKREAGDRSLLSRFQAMDPGRDVVTEGGPIQESVSRNAQNMEDDPIFSVGGDLAFNWVYTNNGHRVVMTGGYLSPADVNDDKTRGLGNHYYCYPLTGAPKSSTSTSRTEVSTIAYAPANHWQGTDHGYGSQKDGLMYGNYAIYVSEDATSFPGAGYKLGLEVEVQNRLKFLESADL